MSSNSFQDLSDEQLLSLVKEGNRLAFTQIYYKYWEDLYNNVYNILWDQGLTEDVLHEVFVDVWSRRDVIEIKSLKSYLFKAVRNNALLQIRNDKFVAFNSEMIESLVLKPEVELRIAKKELKSSIEEAIKELPARCRAIFYMSRYQDYSINEIAAHFDISHRTVENQLHRALKHLRSNLGVTLFLILFS